MGYWISFIMSIVLTSLSYLLGSRLLKHPLTMWQAVIIGTLVVSLGALTETLHAPIWLIILVPFPVGMILLYIFLQESISTWLITYITTLIIYTIIHIIVSYFFNFHSLIPAWKLS